MQKALATSIVLRRLGRLCLAAGAAALLAAAPAGAVSVPLDVEFDTGTTGSFGSVEVLQNGDDLDFTVMLDTGGLGPDADLNELYFNLVPEVSGLAITTDDPVTTPYSSTTGPVRGGAGADFDWGVSFGNGSGPPGNGTLQTASFTLSTNEPLEIADLSEQSFPNNVDTDANPILFAAHVQSTDTVFDGDSETVGGGTPSGVIPEPGTALLLGSGLGGLALAGGRRRR